MSSIDPQVADALEFGERDLAANRSGTLSPAQRANVRRQVIAAFGLELFVLGLLTLVVVADIRLATKIIAGAVPVALAVVGVQGLWQTVGDLVRPRVLSVEGPLKFVPERGSTVPGVLVVGSFGHSLDRGSRVPDVMTAGESCRAYYLAASRTFLSLERLSPDSPASEVQ